MATGQRHCVARSQSIQQPVTSSHMRLPQQMYDERLVTPMRQDLTRLGVKEMRTPEEVDKQITEEKGTTLVVVNSVCGCSARMARPAVAIALQNPIKPDHVDDRIRGSGRRSHGARPRRISPAIRRRRRRSDCSRMASSCSCSSAGRSRDVTRKRSRTISSTRSTATARRRPDRRRISVYLWFSE